jgi:hypothetical protein
VGWFEESPRATRLAGGDLVERKWLALARARPQ